MENYRNKEKISVYVSNMREEREHFHQDIELIYVLEGSMDISIGNQKNHLEAEDILVINANKKHSFLASEDILCARLSISYQLVSEVFQSVNIIFWCDSTKKDNDEHYKELRNAMKRLLSYHLNMQKEGVCFGYLSLCYKILDILSVYFLVQSSDKEHRDNQERFEERIFQINNYIRANYNQPISLKDLSEKLYLSNGYLSRFFKKHYGMSFAEYLENIRLYHAVDELLYSNAPITRIAYDNGFASVAVFNKSFKKTYGETPSAFRRKSTQQNEKKQSRESVHIAKERLEHFLVKEGVEEEEANQWVAMEANHSVMNKKMINTIWNNMINVGTAEELLRSEVQEHVILLRETLGFKYVRFWNLFSSQLLIDITSDEGMYNFSRLDGIFDFLILHDIKPHIELGQKPKRIHKNVQKILVKRNPTSEFTTMEQWNRLLDAFMRHLVHRYGRREIDQWRIELWFDEDKRRQEEAKREYLEKFQNTARIIRKYSAQIKIGGCGMRGDFERTMDVSFFQDWGKQEYTPDYVSIIYFAYVRGEIEQDQYSKRSTDNEGLGHWVFKAKGLLKEAGMSEVPLVISEWNLSISDRNYINDSCFKGAYMMKNILDIQEEVAEVSYFAGTDRVSEHYDSNELLHGGTGLIAKDGILKPAAFSIYLLNRLYHMQIGKGENYLITTDEHDTYGIVCHNQKKLNYNYYFTNEDDVEKEHLWKYYEDRNSINIKFTLNQMRDGVYQMKTYHVNEQNGNIMGLWSEMQYDKELSREEIAYFRRICEPKLTMEKIEVKDGICSVEIDLMANEIAFINLQKMV